MHFFVARLLSVAAITETYVRYIRNLRPMKRLIYYTHAPTPTYTHTHTANKIKQRECAARVLMRDLTVV